MLVPGERLVLNGILRSFQKVVKGEKTNQFDLYLEVNSIEQDQRNYGEIEILSEEETEILKLAKSPDLLSIISQSILPAISGLEEEKKGITLALFSPHQETSCGKKLRGSIHLDAGRGSRDLKDYAVPDAQRHDTTGDLHFREIYQFGRSDLHNATG